MSNCTHIDLHLVKLLPRPLYFEAFPKELACLEKLIDIVESLKDKI